jgi:hypothetical protein
LIVDKLIRLTGKQKNGWLYVCTGDCISERYEFEVDSGVEKVASSCKIGDEPSVSTKCGGLLDWLRNG